jgi:hypothetical protein
VKYLPISLARAAARIRTRLDRADRLADILPFYEQLVPVLETALWEVAPDPERFQQYHALFAEMEARI